MRVRPDRSTTPPLYAVFRLSMPGYHDLVRALGRDFIEIESPKMAATHHGPVLFIETRGLDPATLLRLCRVIALQSTTHSEFGAFMEAIHGDGLALPAKHCIVCGDPLAPSNCPKLEGGAS